MELDFDLMQKNMKYTFVISLSGILFPFAVSIASSWAVFNSLEPGNEYSFGIYLLFMGVAMSITAFPVLARIITETQMFTTDLGVITLSTAAWDDVAAWILLALSIGLATGGAALNALWSFLLLIAYCIIMFTLVRFLLHKVYIVNGRSRSITPTLFATVLILILANSWLTEYFGLHGIFGAFIFGVVLPRQDKFVIKVAEKFEDFVLCLLLPIYFALSGLRTRIDLINSGNAAGLMLLLICVALVSKVFGGFIAAKLVGLTWRQSLTLGFLISSKGLVELIVLNIGLDSGIISEQVFTMMVIMAIVLTFVTTPTVRLLYPINKVAMYESKREDGGSVVVCVKYTSHVNHMMNFAYFLAQDENKNLYAIHSVGNQERPSAFMSKPESDEVLSYVRKTADALNISCKTQLVTYGNTQKDCAKQTMRIAKSKKADFVLMAWKIEEQELEGNMGNSMIELLSYYAECKAIILTEKPGVVFPSKIRHIEFIYSASPHDTEAARVIRSFLKYNPKIKLSIIQVHDWDEKKNRKDHLILDLLKHPRASRIEINSEKPTEEVIELLSKKKDQSVCLIGSDIKWDDVIPRGVNYHRLVSEVNRPFVIVTNCFSFKEVNTNSETNTEIQPEEV